mmetsp:Transcript_60804/g.162612  ORF Transcript_60804/g.162612 Transcript_60804/m.162612 type:complete len:103 (-) Transcript_60804:1550-1858(-)
MRHLELELEPWLRNEQSLGTCTCTPAVAANVYFQDSQISVGGGVGSRDAQAAHTTRHCSSAQQSIYQNPKSSHSGGGVSSERESLSKTCTQDRDDSWILRMS